MANWQAPTTQNERRPDDVGSVGNDSARPYLDPSTGRVVWWVGSDAPVGGGTPGGTVPFWSEDFWSEDFWSADFWANGSTVPEGGDVAPFWHPDFWHPDFWHPDFWDTGL